VTAQNPLERTLLLALGAAALTRERAQAVVDEVVRRGELSRREGKELVDDLMDRAAGQGSGLRERLDADLQDLFRRWGLATHGEWEELNLKVAQLEHRISLLEGASEAAAKPEAASPLPGAEDTPSASEGQGAPAPTVGPAEPPGSPA
jgi:polyhydroxyalkanoate synthesis regulator phasin